MFIRYSGRQYIKANVARLWTPSPVSSAAGINITRHRGEVVHGGTRRGLLSFNVIVACQERIRESPCKTSSRSSIETIAPNCLLFSLSGDRHRQTDEQADKQMDNIIT